MKRVRPRLFERPPHWPALLTRELLCAYLGDISRQLLARWRSRPGFPAPLQTRGVQRWSRAAVDRWIDSLSPPTPHPLATPRRTSTRQPPPRHAVRALTALLAARSAPPVPPADGGDSRPASGSAAARARRDAGPAHPHA